MQALVFKDFYHRFVLNVEGCSNWNDLSFLGSLHRYKKCPGEQCISYKSNCKHMDLINILAEDIPSDAIHLVNDFLLSVKKSEHFLEHI